MSRDLFPLHPDWNLENWGWTDYRTIEPLNARELEYLGNGRPPVDYTPDPGYTPATQDVPQQIQMDEMEVDNDY